MTTGGSILVGSCWFNCFGSDFWKWKFLGWFFFFFYNWDRKLSSDLAVPARHRYTVNLHLISSAIWECARDGTWNLVVGLCQGFSRCGYFQSGLKPRLQTKQMQLWTLTRVEIMLLAACVQDGAGVTSSPCKSQRATPRTSELIDFRPLRWIPLFQLRGAKTHQTSAQCRTF